MSIKKLTLTAAVAMCSLHLGAQKVERANRVNLGLEYTTELQTSFQAANWANLLLLAGEVPLGRGVAIETKSLSIAMTREESLVADFQGFSNIAEADLPLAFAVLGLGWKRGDTELFAGVRNVNEDYFTSPCTSLFTNSSCGIFPTISANYDIANYPLASVCIDLRQRWKDWTLQASVYNGQGYNRLFGHENIFRIRPVKDGVFGMTTLSYEPKENSYSVGCAVHFIGNEASCAPWLNLEQRLTAHLHLLAQGSVNLAATPECKHYEALGIVARVGKIESGLILNHAAFRETNEWAAELTCKISLTQNISLQPTFHLIRTGNTNSTIAMLRMSYALHD